MTFKKKLQGVLAKGLSVSKALASMAGEEAKYLAAKGALKIEAAQLKYRAGKLISKLGEEVYQKFVNMDKSTVSRENPSISEILDEIKCLQAKIDSKEREYRTLVEDAIAKA
jgi:hypothetical protein